MTEQEITGVGPAFAATLRRFRFRRSVGRIRNSGRAGPCGVPAAVPRVLPPGPDGRPLRHRLPRVAVRPPPQDRRAIALAAGTAVRTLRQFLVTARWDHDRARTTLQRHLADARAAIPADAVGTVGVIGETRCRKCGALTPGVQRQYFGGIGKGDNGLVTVHVEVAKSRPQALLDAGLDLPEPWSRDRARCRAAGLPAVVRYQPKWRLALDQTIRRGGRGVTFDGLVSGEGSGAAVPLPEVLNLAGPRFVAEVSPDGGAAPCRGLLARSSVIPSGGTSRPRVRPARAA